MKFLFFLTTLTISTSSINSTKLEIPVSVEFAYRLVEECHEGGRSVSKATDIIKKSLSVLYTRDKDGELLETAKKMHDALDTLDRPKAKNNRSYYKAFANRALNLYETYQKLITRFFDLDLDKHETKELADVEIFFIDVLIDLKKIKPDGKKLMNKILSKPLFMKYPFLKESIAKRINAKHNNGDK
jgi:hypothetical protein